MWNSPDELEHDVGEIEKKLAVFWDDDFKRRYLNQMLHYLDLYPDWERPGVRQRVMHLIEDSDKAG